MMTSEEDYKQQLMDAAWKIDPDFNYSFNVEICKGDIISAQGDILLENKDFSYNYRFTLGRFGMMFSDTLSILGGRKGDFSKNMQNKIIDFNEQLTKSMNFQKIIIHNERSENVRNLYISRGYNANKNLPKTLEKELK
jgi:hypothetical protein